MTSHPRQQFKTLQDWYNFLQGKQILDGQEAFQLRKDCYAEIEKLRQRPLLVYASRFLDQLPPGAPNFLDLSDIDGFTDLVN